MRTQTKEIQEHLTPADAHRILVEGNYRFVQNVKAQRNLKEQVLATSTGQFPFAVVLSCIDSRVPAELVFDQGIGDIFSVRIAGNIVNEDILGSMEFACKLAGSKIVVVMGHTRCGAVNGACNHVEMGNLTPLLNKIQPAVQKVNPSGGKMEREAIEQVTVENVKMAINEIRERSAVLSEMEKNGEIEIVGAMYSVESGEVEFL
ncbi:carbonic anhydrase [Paracrocinitomix mangrovi]|uniref:carbonic anhydrase family protein n=1 Tax=Paracrocinitomix mangrovi TaxID=2862509 RepID=UPI001C8DB996|nr:carbonic anhydrase family protein [Paracrocinitomix mangrovi]UKN02052.1 carbonic anhydrase [Paracrocinitomix mangrovi]